MGCVGRRHWLFCDKMGVFDVRILSYLGKMVGEFSDSLDSFDVRAALPSYASLCHVLLQL